MEVFLDSRIRTVGKQAQKVRIRAPSVREVVYSHKGIISSISFFIRRYKRRYAVN